MAKEKKTNAMRMLERANIPYREYTYECEDFQDGVSSTQKLGLPLESSFKTLVAAGKSGQHYVLVIPVAEEVDFKKAAKAVGEKSIELIHVKDLTALTGYVRGGCSPIGMKKQYPTVIHKTAEGFDAIVVSGGRVGLSLSLSPADLLKATRGSYADLVRQTE